MGVLPTIHCNTPQRSDEQMLHQAVLADEKGEAQNYVVDMSALGLQEALDAAEYGRTRAKRLRASSCGATSLADMAPVAV